MRCIHLIIAALTLGWAAHTLAQPQALVGLDSPASVDYGSALSGDNSRIYFTHASPDFSQRTLMTADISNGAVTNVEPLLLGGKPVSGGDVKLSPNGKTLLFYSREAFDRDTKRTDGDLYYANLTPDGWSAPLRFPDIINTAEDEYYPTLTNSGNLYFARQTPNNSYDLFVAKYQNGAFRTPTKLNSAINTNLLESDAYIAPDESFMVFVRMYEPQGFGVSDLYLSFNHHGVWTEAINLGSEVNFAGVDGSPFVTSDQQWLYFTSNRSAPDPTIFDGHLNIYRMPFKPLFERLVAYKSSSSGPIYTATMQPQVYFSDGPAVLNTSMPDSGNAHYYTDNRGFDWGPTTLYERLSGQDLHAIRFEKMKIPADVHITPDGKQLYYVDYGDNPSQIYVLQKAADGWHKPTKDNRFPPHTGYLTSTRSGVFYFAKQGDLYRMENNVISALPEHINSNEAEHDPFIAQDESFLLFVRQDAPGDTNVYLTQRHNASWSTPVKLPSPANSSGIDGSPFVSADGCFLFVSSNRAGEVTQTWQIPLTAELTNIGRSATTQC